VFCDWYIELVKARLSDKGTQTNKDAQSVLVYVLSGVMKLLHPFMPFITEEIWQTLPHDGESIMISDYPAYTDSLSFPAEEAAMAKVIDAIRAVRNIRAEMNVPNSRKAFLFIVTADTATFAGKDAFFQRLASASGVEVIAEKADDKGCVRVITDACEILIPIADMIDKEEETARLTKELTNAENEIARAEKKLANADFVAKAPAKLVEGERAKIETFRAKCEKLRAAIENLKSI
jgi:valyl-tRNA synthetase